MDRHAADAQAEPHHADMGAGDGGVGRFGDQHGVGAVAAGQGGEGAVAGALLLGHGLHMDVRGQLKPGGADGVEREHHRRHALLHVAGAPPVQPFAFGVAAERRSRPQSVRPGRHHVDMALDDEAAADRRGSPACADDLHGAGVVGVHHRAEAGEMAHVEIAEHVAVDAVAAGGELARHPILQRRFLAADGGEFYQFGQERRLFGEPGVDRPAETIEHHAASALAASRQIATVSATSRESWAQER